jgi:hypothetical protein
MMTPSRMRELLTRTPFRPFRIFLSDGSRHEVPHPEFAWVMGGRIFIGGAASADDWDVPVKELPILHVTRVEETRQRKGKKRTVKT